jgi:hypothetical protein
MNRLILALVALVLSSCASTVPITGFSAVAPVSAEKATVYVIQGSAGMVSENLPVFVGGEKIGVLSLRSYTWFQCDAGVYKIAIGDALVSHRMLAATEIKLSGGDAVYLKYVLNPKPNGMALIGGLLGDIVSRNQVSTPDPLFHITKEEATKLLSKYQLVGNTLKLTQSEPTRQP